MITTEGPALPITGPRSSTHEGASAASATHARSLVEVAEGKRAANKPLNSPHPSDVNARRVRREGWSRGGASPNQRTPKR